MSERISVNILKLISGLCHVEITKYFNKMLLTCEFPEAVNKAIDASSLYKSSESTCKVNYRQISVATAMPKVFERLIAKQINSFVTTKISSLLCAYRKGHSAQHALIRVIETIRKTLDRKGVAGMILIDLSKAFDCMPHDLLIAKLKAYGFGLQGLRLIANYLSDRKQRVKVGSTYSDWLQMKTGVSQGSVLEPLLLNISYTILYTLSNIRRCVILLMIIPSFLLMTLLSAWLQTLKNICLKRSRGSKLMKW